MSGGQDSNLRRIAVVTPTLFWHWDPTRSTINIEYYVHALRSLGYDAFLVCPEGSECSEDVEWMTFPVERYKDADFWKTLNIDAAIMFTWLQYAEELRALRQAGVVAISRADTDGTKSVRIFPAETFDFIVAGRDGAGMRLRMLAHWVDIYLRLYHKLDAVVIESIEAADIIAVETNTARERIQKTLDFYKRTELGQKMRVCPHLVAGDILDAPMPPLKRQKIVAIGRWNARQKDAPLLSASLRVCLQQEPQTEVVLIGGDGDEAFAKLRAEFPQVVCTGAIPRLEIKSHLADAQILVLSSRYESFHIAAHEALCFGCTVVGPDVIPLPDICGAGDYGRLATPRNPKALGDALVEEIVRWRGGQRVPEDIARFWRARLQSKKVLSDMLPADRSMPETRLHQDAVAIQKEA